MRIKKILCTAIVTAIGTAIFAGNTSLKCLAADDTQTASGGAILYEADAGSDASEPITSGDYQYQILSNGTIEISMYTGSDKNVTIPSKIDGYKVTVIADWSFYGDFESVVIPSGVTKIEEYAFYQCAQLKSITIPEGVTSIGDCAFDMCSTGV